MAADRIAAVRPRRGRGFGRRWLDGRFDFQRHAPHQHHEADAAARNFLFVTESGSYAPPFFALENGAERFLDGLDIILPADFLLQRTVETDDVLRRNGAPLGIIFGQSARFGIPRIEDHRRGCGFAGGAHAGFLGVTHGDQRNEQKTKSRYGGRHGRGGCGAGGVFRSPHGRGRGRCGSNKRAAHRRPWRCRGLHSARGGSGEVRGAGRR